jgi:hypothetical protein
MTPEDFISRELAINAWVLSPGDVDRVARYVLKAMAIDTPIIAKRTEKEIVFNDGRHLDL